MKANINEDDAERALRYKFIPKVNYQLGSYSLTQSQYEELQNIYEPYTISKMGYNQHWPKALRYGNVNEMGLNLPNLYLEQFILHIKNIQELLLNDETNILMINVLQMFQLSAGIKKSF